MQCDSGHVYLHSLCMAFTQEVCGIYTVCVWHLHRKCVAFTQYVCGIYTGSVASGAILRQTNFIHKYTHTLRKHYIYTYTYCIKQVLKSQMPGP